MGIEIVYEPFINYTDASEKLLPYKVQWHGSTLASFKTRAQAESYRKSKLLEIALDLRGPILSEALRHDDPEEETLP